MADAEKELTLEEREKKATEERAATQQGKTGFETEAPAEEKPLDPRAAKRAELLEQLAALDVTPPNLAETSDKDLHIMFFDALVNVLGSHPALDSLWSEMRKRIFTQPTATAR